MECAYSEFFEEPELFVRILSRRFRAVSETCVRKITMREEKHHLLITVTAGGVGRLHLRHTELMCSFNEVAKPVSCSSSVCRLPSPWGSRTG